MAKVLFLSIIFLLNPLVGIFLFVISFWQKDIPKNGYLYAFAFMLSFFLGLQNTGKELTSDLEEYRKIFFSVPKFHSSIEYLLHFGKEPIYYGYNYLTYYLFGGSWSLFILSVTIINYMLLSYAVIETGKIIRTNFRNIIITLLFLLFFFQEFASSGHMIRQCLAQSITVVFFVSWYIEKKKRWWLAMIALGVHTAALPVLGVGLVPILKDKFTFKTFSIIVGAVGVLTFIFTYLSSFFSAIPFFSYIIARANSNLLETDSWQKNVGLELSSLVLISGVIVLIFYIYTRVGKIAKDRERYNDEELILSYINITVIIILAILIWNMIGAYYLLMRYFFFIYAFQNVIILLFLHYWNPRSKYVYTTISVVLLSTYFMTYYVNGVFHYYPLKNMLLHPIPLYFLN